MIQRVQSIYILFAALLTALLLKVDFAELAVNNNWYVFNAKGISGVEGVLFDGLPLIIFIGLITLLHVIALILFKKRIKQIRILGFSIVLLLGLIGIMMYFLYAGFDDAEVVFKIPVVFPLIAGILDYLAIRAIGKDEALIRSIDRIR